ncbi:MAG: hypothetical protein U5M50_10520 [Sphingobium sp.]|nr:hypothetical protein [Sphingobium sp.]
MSLTREQLAAVQTALDFAAVGDSIEFQRMTTHRGEIVYWSTRIEPDGAMLTGFGHDMAAAYQDMLASEPVPSSKRKSA